MLATDENAVICDFAQTYGVLHYRDMPVTLLAALAAGLGEDSRIMRRLSGACTSSDTMLLAAAVDRLSLLCWMQTEDGQKGRNRPPSILSQLMNPQQTSVDSEVMTFDSAESFRAAWDNLGV